jgi:hypothetical protein
MPDDPSHPRYTLLGVDDSAETLPPTFLACAKGEETGETPLVLSVSEYPGSDKASPELDPILETVSLPTPSKYRYREATLYTAMRDPTDILTSLLPLVGGAGPTVLLADEPHINHLHPLSPELVNAGVQEVLDAARLNQRPVSKVRAIERAFEGPPRRVLRQRWRRPGISPTDRHRRSR